MVCTVLYVCGSLVDHVHTLVRSSFHNIDKETRKASLMQNQGNAATHSSCSNHSYLQIKHILLQQAMALVSGLYHFLSTPYSKKGMTTRFSLFQKQSLLK
jgi:hypothetical protein